MAYEASNVHTPKLEGQALKRYTDKNIKENIFQSILAIPEKGVTERFSEDVRASEIRIIRQIEPTGEARELGGTVNGGWYDTTEVGTPTSAEYPISILYTYDHPVDIPAVMDDMVELPVAEATTRNIGGKVARLVNASTLATQIGGVINAKLDGEDTNEVIEGNLNNIKDAIMEACAKLDDGDTANGIDIYPDDQRQIFIRPSTYAKLMKNGEIIVGGSNYAQEMLARGGLSPNTYVNNGNGYCGEINGVPVYKVSKPVWEQAEKWMGLTPGKLDSVDAVVVSGLATGRALAFSHSVKIVDTQNGQGKRIQPLYRWGVELLTQTGIVPILKHGTTLTGPGTGIVDSDPVVIGAPGSRA